MDSANSALAVKRAKKAAWRMKMGLPAQADDAGSDDEKVEIDWNEEANRGKEGEEGKKVWKGKGKAGKGGKSKEDEDEERAQRGECFVLSLGREERDTNGRTDRTLSFSFYRPSGVREVREEEGSQEVRRK